MNLGKTSSSSRLRKTFMSRFQRVHYKFQQSLWQWVTHAVLQLRLMIRCYLTPNSFQFQITKGQFKLLLIQNGYLNFKYVTFLNITLQLLENTQSVSLHNETWGVWRNSSKTDGKEETFSSEPWPEKERHVLWMIRLQQWKLLLKQRVIIPYCYY